MKRSNNSIYELKPFLGIRRRALVPAFILSVLFMLLTGPLGATATTLDWATRASMPTPRLGLAAVVAADGTIFAIGGFNEFNEINGNLATIEQYNPATDTWTAKAPMLTPHRDLGVALANNGKIYAFGGVGIGNTWVDVPVEEYDPATNVWTIKEHMMPTFRQGLGVTAANNGKIYAIGGYNGSQLAVVEEYDPATDMWTTRKSMDVPRGNLAVATAANGKIYAAGGNNDFGLLDAVEEYDPATDMWTTRAPLLVARRYFTLVAAPSGKLYAIGGEGSATVDEYDPATDTWITLGNMLTPRNRLGAVVANNGNIYTIGGTSATGIVSIVEEGTLVPINNPPDLTIDSPIVEVVEGQTANNGGTVSDPDGDIVTLSASLGVVINNNDGTWSWSFDTSDGPSESQTVTISADDGNGGTDQVTFDLAVNNVAPTVDAGADMTIINTESLDVTATFTDPGVWDTHTATIDFDLGDGPEVAAIVVGTVKGSQQYMIPLNYYTVEVCVTDNDGDTGCDSLTLYVQTPGEAIQDLINAVTNMNLQQGIDNSLDAKLDAAQGALEDVNTNNDVAAINALEAFINAVEAQRGGKLTDAQADLLVASAQRIIDTLVPPTLASPVDGALVTSPVTVTWAGDPSLCYQVQVDNDTDLSSPIDDVTVVYALEYTTSVLADGPYYWRVAKSGNCSSATGPWSDAWSFTIETP